MPCLEPERVVTLDPTRLAFSHDNTHYNASVIDWHGRLLLAYRVGRGGSQLHMAELDSGDLQPVKTTHITPLLHELCHAGREDPRLFVYGGQLHMSFCGVKIGEYHPQGPAWDRRTQTHVLYVPLGAGDEPAPGEVVYPDYAARTWPLEKNWVFFEWAGELMCVYRTRPHVVLHIRDGKAYPFTETAGLNWPFAEPRGGASPVLHNGEFWHFFHDAHYRTGVYTFEAKPPFRVTRWLKAPLIVPTRHDLPPSWNFPVSFPCGATLRDGKWLVSAGHHDTWVRVYVFDAGELEKRMVKV